MSRGMIAAPDTVRIIGGALDHPEGVCVGPDGTLYTGGEAGQVYRIPPGGEPEQYACTGGFLLGLALDAGGGLHACDASRRAVLHIGPDGAVTERSRGTPGRPLTSPNFPVFDAAGNLYVSDSGDYWDARGTGAIFVVRPDNTTELFHAGPFRFANGLAIDPAGAWLHVAQSTAGNVVRLPLGHPNGPVEITHMLPPHSVPDGLAFAADGRLVISCYRPDIVYLGSPGGLVEVLIEDHTAELLNRPANAALHGGFLYLSNLGGWHLSAVATDLRPAPLHRPACPSGSNHSLSTNAA